MANTGQSSQRAGQEARTTTAPTTGSRRPVLYLLSSDDELLIELGPLLGNRYRTRPIDSAEQLEPAGDVPWAMLIDATTRTDARAQAARLEQQHPLVPLLIVCATGTASDWASARARGMVSAVVERDTLQTVAFADALATVDRQLSASAPETPLASAPARRRPVALRWPFLLLIAIAIVFAASLAWHLRSGSPTATARTSTPHPIQALPAAPAATAAIAPAAAPAAVIAPAPAPAPQRPVLELLSAARVAFREGKSLMPRADEPPRGDSALELYTQVLAQDPQNEEARDGLHRLFTVARARLQSDLGTGKLDEAGRLVAAFRNAGIARDELAAFDAQIAAARPRWLVSQVRAAIASGDANTATQLMAQLAAGGGDRGVLAQLRRELEASNTQNTLAELAARVHTAISAGALLNPDPDNAQARVLAMQQLDRIHPLTLAAQRELQAALLARARSLARAAQFDQAQQLLATAANFGNGAELANARKQLQDDMQAAQNRAAAETAARDAQKQAATADSAPADFIRAKPLAPITMAFPQQAFDAGLHGYVIVEFMLNPKGRALDPRVVEAVPARVFDAAALQAVRSGRYDTSALSEPDKAQRARIRIVFK